jgi:hypothetical protein
MRKSRVGWAQWIKPVILVTWEAKIRRIVVGGQTRQKSWGELHLNQWVGTEVPTCLSRFVGKYKWEDSGPGWPGIK